MSHLVNKFKLGDKVVCISNPPGNSFTIGKEYIVLSFKDYGDDKQYNSFRNDKDNLQVANHKEIAPHFELVTEKKKTKIEDKGWGL